MGQRRASIRVEEICHVFIRVFIWVSIPPHPEGHLCAVAGLSGLQLDNCAAVEPCSTIIKIDYHLSRTPLKVLAFLKYLMNNTNIIRT